MDVISWLIAVIEATKADVARGTSPALDEVCIPSRIRTSSVMRAVTAAGSFASRARTHPDEVSWLTTCATGAPS